MKRISAIIVLVCLFLAALACASAPVSTPTLPPAQTPSTIPTSTPTPTSTPARPVINEAELKYDSGNGSVISQVFYSPTDLLQYGYLIDFAPPSVPFIIQKVSIYGIARYCPV